MSVQLTEKLEIIAQSYDSTKDFDYQLIRFDLRCMRGRLQGPKILELGCANGVMTESVSEMFPVVDVVDGSETYLKDVARRLSDRRNVRYFHSLFEDFVPADRYDSIILARALEHLEDPVETVRKVSQWLNPEGTLHIVVPNSRSLNRRIGVAMGLIARCDALDDRDRRVGHLRVYDFATLRSDLEQAGLVVHEMTGVFLKPLSNAQMESWDPKIVEALFEIGKELPEYCTQIYAVCSPRR
jgi:2-polyprenyl-3-methyl-5-hydroxy-6-metoxy-1,4-benzoquinol methylase